MKKIPFIFLLAFTLNGLAQESYTLKFRIDSMQNQKAFLIDYENARFNKIDSAFVDGKNQLNFSLPASAHPGLYRLFFGPGKFLNFIFNKENISISTHYGFVEDSLKVYQSEENKLLRDYLQIVVKNQRKMDLLFRLQSLYAPNDDFGKKIQAEINHLQFGETNEFVDQLIREHPDSYFARFLKTERYPVVPDNIPDPEKNQYLIDHFFEDVNFSDTSLLYSPPLIERVRAYFSLYERIDNGMEVEEKYIVAFNRLMSLAAVNDKVFDYILQDIYDIAKRSGMDQFYVYITENYMLDASCQNEESKEEMKDRLAILKRVAVGKPAPEIIIPRENEPPLMLSEMDQDYVLILFWASWCGHCMQSLPQLKSMYKELKSDQFEVLAISLDKERDEWQHAIKQAGFDWMNYSELKGWDCSIAYDYGINATPTMILVDKNRNIIQKPYNLKQLEKKLRELGLFTDSPR